MRYFKQFHKSYASPENAIQAVKRKHPDLLESHTWLVAVDESGRYSVVFVGQKALQEIGPSMYPITG